MPKRAGQISQTCITSAILHDMKINRIDIGARIRYEVEAQHWTYAEFARAINCSRSSLYNIFNSTDINLSRLIQICKVLNVDLIREAYLFEDNDIQTNGNTDPYISIPLNNGRFDLSKIPYQLLLLLKSEIDSDPRLIINK